MADESARASRLDSHAEASTSADMRKSKSQEQRDKTIQEWLEKRAPKTQQPSAQDQRQSGTRAPSMATLKHRLLNGHNYPVTCVVFSPNGEHLATASRDVRIYNAHTGVLRCILDGHGGLVRSIAFTPDGRLLCSGSDDCSALVWALEHCFVLCSPGTVVTLTPPGSFSSSNMPNNESKGNIVATPTRPTSGAPHSPSTAPPSSSPPPVNGPLTAGSSTSSSSNFSPMTRVVQRVLRRHHKPVLSVATTPDSKYLVTGSADKTVRVWDVCTGYIMATLRGHTGEVNYVSVTPNGRRIVSSGADKIIFVWDFVTGECKRALRGHKGPVSCMAIAPDGHFLVTGSHDKTVRVWDLLNGNECANLAAHTGAFGVLCCAVSPDGTTIMSGGYDNLIKLWDASSGLALATIPGHRHMISSVAFNHDCTMLATASRDDEVRLWTWAHARATREAMERASVSNTIVIAGQSREDIYLNALLQEVIESRYWSYFFADEGVPTEEDPIRAAIGLRARTLSRGVSMRLS